MGIRDIARAAQGIGAVMTGLILYPAIKQASEKMQEDYPAWIFHGDYHAKVHIPESVKLRKVWLVSPTGDYVKSMDYITARRIREKQGWYINIKEPKMPPMASLASIIQLMPTLTFLGIIGGIGMASFGKGVRSDDKKR